MKKVSAIYKESVEAIRQIYGLREAENIVNLILEKWLEISRIDRLTHDRPVDEEEQRRIRKAVHRLKQSEPVQHILEEAYFYGRPYKITRDTLIPRPETEELVHLIVQNHQQQHIKVLDIGTGSGCIAISLDLELSNATVSATDISSEALEIAHQNAMTHGSGISLNEHDILQSDFSEFFDVIVSNPPYIPISERAEMNANVTEFDPSLALFVPDHNPLVFYERIAQIGITVLSSEGSLYFEIHQNFGNDVCGLLKKYGYKQLTLTKDMQGNDRIVHAIKV